MSCKTQIHKTQIQGHIFPIFFFLSLLFLAGILGACGKKSALDPVPGGMYPGQYPPSLPARKEEKSSYGEAYPREYPPAPDRQTPQEEVPQEEIPQEEIPEYRPFPWEESDE